MAKTAKTSYPLYMNPQQDSLQHQDPDPLYPLPVCRRHTRFSTQWAEGNMGLDADFSRSEVSLIPELRRERNFPILMKILIIYLEWICFGSSF